MKKELQYYNELVQGKKNSDQKITYLELLNTFEWYQKRLEIIDRDSEQCTKCNVRQSKFINGKAYINYTPDEEKKVKNNIENDVIDLMNKLGVTNYHSFEIEKPLHLDINPVSLHVHHKFYIKGKLPWEYSNNALISLCKSCHQEIHDNEKIPVYVDDSMREKLEYSICNRCNGSGHLPEYDYYLNGICFQCEGNIFRDF